MSQVIQIVEVGPRDGLQNEAAILPPEIRAEFVRRLEDCGVTRIEAVSFVNPKRVPQMAGAEEIMAELPRRAGRSRIGLALNRRGWDRAVAAGCDEANVVVCATDGFGIRNQGAGVTEQLATLAHIVAARNNYGGPPISLTVSVAFGCPFDGEVSEDQVMAIVRAGAELGIAEIALADTIGARNGSRQRRSGGRSGRSRSGRQLRRPGRLSLRARRDRQYRHGGSGVDAASRRVRHGPRRRRPGRGGPLDRRENRQGADLGPQPRGGLPMTPLHILAPGLLNLGAAFVGGSLVGLERSYNGRVAGFRTHALVAIAAASAMTVAYSPGLLLALAPGATAPGDITRLAQGVMTGVGFLGGGVIFKEGANIQGLTTAASIWATAAIGLLCGVGLWPTALAASVLVLLVLTAMRYVEAWVPARVRAEGAFRFKADTAPDDAGFRRLLGGHGVVVSDISYRLIDGGETFEYRAQIEDRGGQAFDSLAQRLRTSAPELKEFELDRISK